MTTQATPYDVSNAGPQRFRSRPTEITAIQWTGQNEAQVKTFVGRRANGKRAFMHPSEITGPWEGLWVEKSQAWCDCPAGTWIIAEPDGVGFYPCAPDVFDKRWKLDE